MKKIGMIKAFLVIGISIPMVSKAADQNSAKNSSTQTFNHTIVVENRSSDDVAPVQSVAYHELSNMYNKTAFSITTPVKVCVGQPFDIDYAVRIPKFTHISFWSDLLPDDNQGLPIELVEVVPPTLGTFDIDDETIAHKGGRGLWLFPKGLPGGTVQHLKITVKATKPGLIKFSTIIATNPPSYVGTAGTSVSCYLPTLRAAYVQGLSNQPLEIPILDYVTSDSPVEVTGVSQASYGSVQINEDYTITYSPYSGFYGNDSFTYTITDAAGNSVKGKVSVLIKQSPVPQIIQ